MATVHIMLSLHWRYFLKIHFLPWNIDIERNNRFLEMFCELTVYTIILNTSYFSFLIYFHVYECVPICVCMCIIYVPDGSRSQRECMIPCNWSCRWYWVAVWEAGTVPGSSARTGALNIWAIYLQPH